MFKAGPFASKNIVSIDRSCHDWWIMPAALMSRARWGGDGAFAIYQHRGKREFYELSQKICRTKKSIEAFRLEERSPSELESIKGKLNQLAENFRLEIRLLARSETIEYSK